MVAQPPRHEPPFGVRVAAGYVSAFDDLPDGQPVLTEDEGSPTSGSACVPDTIT